MDDREARILVGRAEALLAGLDGAALEAVEALAALYGEGLARIAAQLERPVVEELAGDELVGHLLMLHDLHPLSLEERVERALDGVRPYLASHGGGVELLGVGDGVARLRLQGHCDGCPSSTMTLRLAVENAIRMAAPELDSIEAEGAAEEPPAPPLLQIEGVASMATGPPAPPLLQIENAGPPAAGWSQVGELPQLAGGGTLLRRVGSDELLFLRVDGDTYAYRPRCPGCGGSLAEGVLHGVEVACPGCRRRFDVRRAGRCLEAPQLHLEPVPLLVDGAGTVKVALA